MDPDVPPLVSVLIPSRGRPDVLRQAIINLRENATAPGRVEVLVAHDPDDRATGIATACLNVLVVQPPRRYGRDRLGQYYDWLATRATGDWLLLWTDTAPVARQWDALLAGLPDDAERFELIGADLNIRHAVRRCAYARLTAAA